jgi:TetR/AcrR family transcriptional regulator, acrAB operon repressor
MARKCKEDADLTCSALLDAAEQTFYEKGVASTTLNDIASAAGMTRGAVYWHFKDKADVLQAMLARAMMPKEAMIAQLEAASDADALGSLRTMCVQSLVNLAQSPSQQRVYSVLFLKCENVGALESVLELKRAQQCEYKSKIQAVMDKAVASGQLPRDTDVPMAQQAVANFISGTMREWLFAPQAYALDARAPALVDMLLAGLQASPPRRVV